MASLRAGRFFETLISSLKIKPLIELENHSSVRASFSALADILLDSKLSSRSRAIQGELVEESNVQKMHIANSDKPIKLYNLDAIISVGYSVNSKRGTQFRLWATGVLREHLSQGWTLD